MKPTVSQVEYEYLGKGIVVYKLEKWNISYHMESLLIFTSLKLQRGSRPRPDLNSRALMIGFENQIAL